MAKVAKNISPAVNMALLGTIATATEAGSFHYVSPADGMPLENAGLIEINTSMLDANGDAASRVTEKGAELVKLSGSKTQAEAPAAPVASTSAFALITDADVPKVRRRGGGGGQKAKYPFASMEIGNSFFVAKSADVPDPVKTLSATVANWNETYKEPTGEMETVTRVKRNKDRTSVVDEAGNKVTETITRPKRKPTRKFVCRPVEGGKTYGNWTAPTDGVLVSRVALD